MVAAFATALKQVAPVDKKDPFSNLEPHICDEEVDEFVLSY